MLRIDAVGSVAGVTYDKGFLGWLSFVVAPRHAVGFLARPSGLAANAHIAMAVLIARTGE